MFDGGTSNEHDDSYGLLLPPNSVKYCTLSPLIYANFFPSYRRQMAEVILAKISSAMIFRESVASAQARYVFRFYSAQVGALLEHYST